MDTTRKLSIVSLEGHNCYLVVYDYENDSNYIFAETIKDVKDATIVTAFKNSEHTCRQEIKTNHQCHQQSCGQTNEDIFGPKGL